MAKIEIIDVNYSVQADVDFLQKTLSRLMVAPGTTTSGGARQQVGKDPFRLKDIHLTIPEGKSMVILGPSGCGKSTLLRLISGLLTPDTGKICYDGVDMVGVPPQDRKIGMVFQNYALYPHFRSEENILSYFRFRKKTPELDKLAQEKYQRTSELMGVELAQLIGRMPAKLSGGERQRIALARCITRDPDVFLLDEPFSNLDLKLREKYRVNLKKLLRHFQITTVYVTHDQHEAVLLADLIGIMDQGRIVQVGTYEELYTHPVNLFVAEFLNLAYETSAINICPGDIFGPAYAGRVVGFRPEDAVVAPGAEGMLAGRVIDAVEFPLKKMVVLTVGVASGDVQLYADRMFSEGEKITLKVNRMHVFDPESGERLPN